MTRKNKNRLDRLIAHAFMGRSPAHHSEGFEQRVMQDIRGRAVGREQHYFIHNICRPMLAASALAAVLLLLVLALGEENSHIVNPYSHFNLDLMYAHTSWFAINGR